MGTWATYHISSNQHFDHQATASSINGGISSIDMKILFRKVLLPLLGISILSSSGLLLYPMKIISHFSNKCKTFFSNIIKVFIKKKHTHPFILTYIHDT